MQLPNQSQNILDVLDDVSIETIIISLYLNSIKEYFYFQDKNTKTNYDPLLRDCILAPVRRNINALKKALKVLTTVEHEDKKESIPTPCAGDILREELLTNLDLIKLKTFSEILDIDFKVLQHIIYDQSLISEEIDQKLCSFYALCPGYFIKLDQRYLEQEFTVYSTSII